MKCTYRDTKVSNDISEARNVKYVCSNSTFYGSLKKKEVMSAREMFCIFIGLQKRWQEKEFPLIIISANKPPDSWS